MKVALVLTGYMRNWKDHRDCIKNNIINNYSADLYITSYTYSQAQIGSPYEKINVEEVLDFYNPKNYIFRDTETCPNFDFNLPRVEINGREWSERMIRGWYTNYLSISLFNFEDYDVIIKSRTDLSVKNFIIDQSKDLVIPAWKVHPGPCDPDKSYVDYFAYGSAKSMEVYFNLYSKIRDLYENYFDVSLGETLIKDYLDSYYKKRIFFDKEIDWMLRDGTWATEQRDLYERIAPELTLKF